MLLFRFFIAAVYTGRSRIMQGVLLAVVKETENRKLQTVYASYRLSFKNHQVYPQFLHLKLLLIFLLKIPSM